MRSNHSTYTSQTRTIVVYGMDTDGDNLPSRPERLIPEDSINSFEKFQSAQQVAQSYPEGGTRGWSTLLGSCVHDRHTVR